MQSHDSGQSGEQSQHSGLQAALLEFRDRVTRAAALIGDLRLKNQDLERRLQALESELTDVRTDLASKSDELTRVLSSIDGGVDGSEKLLYLSSDEREALERGINDLLNRINAHLS